MNRHCIEFIVLCSICLILGSSLSIPVYGAEQDTFSATLTEVEGEVSIQKPEDDTWLPVEENMPLEESDRLKTGQDSSAEILIDDGSLLKVEENTEIVLSELSANLETKRNESSIFLRIGLIISNISDFMHSKSRFSVRTPTMVAGVRGTEFIVEVTDIEKTDLGVFDGKVSVGGVDKEGKLIKGSEVLLLKGKQTSVYRHKRPKPPFALKKGMLLHKKRIKILRKKAIESRRDLRKIIGKRLKAHERAIKNWKRIKKLKTPEKIRHEKPKKIKDPKKKIYRRPPPPPKSKKGKPHVPPGKKK